MTWLRLEDNMLDHPKWRRALRDGGDGVVTLWLRLCSWCSRHLTDGEVPPDMVSEIGELERSKSRTRALQALVESGLCARSEHGAITIVGYLERNPSRAYVLSERERRAKNQRDYADRKKLTGQRPVELPDPDDVPSRPVPSQSRPDPRECLRTPERDAPPESAPEHTQIRGVGGGVSRVVSMPSAEPPKPYLDEALMRGIAPEQARSTWEHYWGAGLPERGVERLHDWLLKRAKERANSQARAGPRRAGTERSDVMAMMAEEIERDRADEAERRARGKV